MNAIDLLIGGKDQSASNQRTFQRHNPISGEIASIVAAASIDDAMRAADAAAAAFPAWSQLGPPSAASGSALPPTSSRAGQRSSPR